MSLRPLVLLTAVFFLAFSLTWGSRKLLRWVSVDAGASIEVVTLGKESLGAANAVEQKRAEAESSAPAASSYEEALVKNAANTAAADSWLQKTAQMISSAEGELLFSLLFSEEFRREDSWRSLLPLIGERLNAQLPSGGESHGIYSRADGESRNRMGLLKALARVEVSPSSENELKKFLFGYLTKAVGRHWLLEREALLSLQQRFRLSDIERAQLEARLDPRALGLARANETELMRSAAQEATP